MQPVIVFSVCLVALAFIVVSTTAQSADEKCERHNGSCADCIAESNTCFYCTKNEKCFHTTATKLTADDRCGTLADMKQLTCFASKMWLYIGIGIGGGVLLLVITICCCCCCRNKNKGGNMKDWLKWERIRETRTAAREEQRAERQNRMDDIRKKYGIEERKYDRSITKNGKF